MRSFFLTILLIIISSFTRGNFQDDTVEVQISDSVMVKAVQKTNSQVDSIFLSSQSKPITFKDLSEGFNGIVTHMDSLNAATIILVKQRDSIELVRHREQLDRIDLINANIMLKKDNKQKEITISMVKGMPHVLMIFVASLAAFFVGQGFINGIKKYRKNAS